MTDKSILIIGGAATGKTHYFGQLALRLEASKGALKYYEPPENLEPIEQAMKCLNHGRAAAHTVGHTTNKVVLPIEFQNGARARLEWPDYAGERLKDLVSRRHGGSDWAEDARNSHAWLLFVRHDQMRSGRDLLNRPVIDVLKERIESNGKEVPWMPQAQVIELLQMLLFLRRASLRSQLRAPILGIALSCYDQLPERERFLRPGDAFRVMSPMLSHFIESNWAASARFVIGLSALGRPLDKEKADENFVDTGPAANGWIITPQGQENTDLTWPLVELLRKA
jgi:hypothetical protein